MKLVQYFDAWKSARLECRMVRAADLLVTNTEEDWQLYKRTFGDIAHVVVRPGYDGARAEPRRWSSLSRVALVLGSFQWIAKRLNIEAFLAEAEPVFRAAGIELRVVGYMDETYRVHLATKYPWAQIVGPVDDVTKELGKARVGIMAERAGGGFKHKMLNYAFSRVAIASLEQAMAGGGFEPGRQYISAASVPELARAIAAVIGDDSALEAMTNEAFASCEKQFDWADRGRDLVAALGKMWRDRAVLGTGATI